MTVTYNVLMKMFRDRETMNNEPEKTKRGRKPIKRSGAMTPAQRKREQRIRQAEAASYRDSHELTAAECLAILCGSRWRGGPIDRGAWLQLGKLRGYCE